MNIIFQIKKKVPLNRWKNQTTTTNWKMVKHTLSKNIIYTDNSFEFSAKLQKFNLAQFFQHPAYPILRSPQYSSVIIILRSAPLPLSTCSLSTTARIIISFPISRATAPHIHAEIFRPSLLLSFLLYISRVRCSFAAANRPECIPYIHTRLRALLSTRSRRAVSSTRRILSSASPLIHLKRSGKSAMIRRARAPAAGDLTHIPRAKTRDYIIYMCAAASLICRCVIYTSSTRRGSHVYISVYIQMSVPRWVPWMTRARRRRTMLSQFFGYVTREWTREDYCARGGYILSRAAVKVVVRRTYTYIEMALVVPACSLQVARGLGAIKALCGKSNVRRFLIIISQENNGRIW